MYVVMFAAPPQGPQGFDLRFSRKGSKDFIKI
uniref:Uncharacterized protein n=1 Tax=Anguilla anguilla TaxID=7936 RepID=A0A0E9QNI1_ANGAN